MPATNEWLKNWTAIINPSSGAGKGERDWPSINMHLQGAGFIFRPFFTEYRGHAIELTEKLLSQGEKKFIVVGGDGTLNEVANGIMNFAGKNNTDEVVTGMIPVGTGNDWGRMYRISSKYKKSVKALAKGKTFMQDVARVRYFRENEEVVRYLVNMAGAGYDALVTKRTNELKEKGKAGLMSYLYQLIKGLFKYRQAIMKVEVDNAIVYEGDVFSLNVGVCRYNGGGMMQLPHAIPDDGLLDVTIIKKTTRRYILRHLHKVFDGSFVNLSKVMTARGKKVKVTGVANELLNLEIDGESLGNSPFHFDIPGRKARFVINKRWDHKTKERN